MYMWYEKIPVSLCYSTKYNRCLLLENPVEFLVYAMTPLHNTYYMNIFVSIGLDTLIPFAFLLTSAWIATSEMLL